MRVLRASLAALLLIIGLAPTVFAAGVTMTTAYPSVVADPGTTVKFQVVVQTDTPQRVDLSVSAQPTGWTTRLQGGGSTIAAVSTVPASTTSATSGGSPVPYTGNYATFTAEVTMPADAAGGSQQIVIDGKATDGSTTQLNLDLNVQTGQTGDVQMTTDFPSLSGPTSTTFKFSLNLANNTNQQITFGLESDAPSGWTVSANPATEADATTAVVDAGSSTQISVSAKSPSDAAAGAYTVNVTATGGPQPVQIPLTVNVTGTYDMTASTSDQRLNADLTAGGTTTLTLVVTNTGTADLTGVKFTSTPPRDWKVTFAPDAVDVPAGQTANVVATIQASNQALAGDYVISMTGRSGDNAASDSLSIRATVETSPIGYLIGIAVLIIVGIGLFFVFQRYGRR
jgi:uncharacterized repeat protein (TIGR01451 family)